jgi:DNA-binding HxlR family transcriptional regulator
MNADGDTLPSRPRTGGTVLSLLAGPLCVPILRAHLDAPLRLPDLRERIGGAAQTTLRGQVGNLRAIGALKRRVRPGMPYTVENKLTVCGQEILEVAGHLETWLARAPQGPIPLGSEGAKGAVRALVAGWSSTVLRSLAAHPLSLTELSATIKEISYPSLERRLSAMRAARQVELHSDGAGKAKPYSVTEWTRQAVVPLLAAGRCECRHLSKLTDPATEVDIEAAFLLAVPLADLPPDSSGSCLLTASEPQGEAAATDADEPTQRVAGVRVEIDDGKVTSCVPDLEQEVEVCVLGTVGAWAKAVVEGSLDDLCLEGEGFDLVHPLIEGIHSALQPA